MTSNPASRSARATTFAPRSCPSSPGFATMMRYFSPAMGARGYRSERFEADGRGHNAAVNTDRYVAEARDAASELRASGSEILPLADAFRLDEPTERLLKALVGLGILAPDDVPALASAAA